MRFTIKTMGRVYRSNGPTTGVTEIIRGLTIGNVFKNVINASRDTTLLVFTDDDKYLCSFRGGEINDYVRDRQEAQG